MNFGQMLAFTAVAATLVVIPGPDWAFVLAAGARHRVVLPAASGLMIGYGCIATVVALGVGPLIAAAPGVLLALTIAGAGYLVYLGVHILRSPAEITQTATIADTRPQRFVTKGIGVSALNPKGLLLFLAILPQFAHTSAAWPMPVQLAVLGAVFIAICGMVYTALGYAADRLLGSRPGVAAITTRVAGIAMIIVGVALLAERLF
jgi:threonine/homoserine/homoserine lactone efflux protein